jgi:hypothetical protein
MLRKILILALACLGWNSTSGAAPYQIGPTHSLQSVSALPQLHPGDVVEIDSGTYKEVMRWTSSGTAAQPIVIRGVGAPVFDADGLRVDGVLPRPRAVFQIEGVIGTPGGGVSGSNNWMQASALVPESFAATVQGASPGFVNRAQGDFHLNSASACRDHGLNTLAFLDGEGLSHPGAPTEEYVAPMRRRTRQNDGRLDIGAFEYFPAGH